MRSDLDLVAKVKGLVKDTDRHGNDRYYFRRKGMPKIRLREPFGTEAFREELRCAELGIPYSGATPTPAATRSILAKPGSLRWLSLEYLRRARSEWDEDTFKRKSAFLAEVCEGTTLSKSGIPNGDLAFAGMQLKHVAQLRDEKADKPDTANRRVKHLSAMFNWAIGAGVATHNPAEKCAKLKTSSTGFHTWTVAEIAQYLEKHPPGTKAHLWLLMLLFTGLRKSDAVQLGRWHLREVEVLRNGSPVLDEHGRTMIERRIVVVPGKTSTTSKVTIDIPLLPPLAAAVDALPPTQMAFMEGPGGKPHSAGTIGNYMRDWCTDAGLPHCSSHGLRKAGAVIAAEAGATTSQLQALFGWTTAQQAERYTRAAERKKLATAGAALLTLPTKVGH